MAQDVSCQGSIGVETGLIIGDINENGRVYHQVRYVIGLAFLPTQRLGDYSSIRQCKGIIELMSNIISVMHLK